MDDFAGWLWFRLRRKPVELHTQDAPSEVDILAHSLAYEEACTAIECNCMPGDSLEQFDISKMDDLAADHIADCVRYLDMLGLLERDPDNPNLVMFRNESEATA